MILRDRDANEPWTSASDGALEERRFYCQNWRADVVAMTLSDGAPWEFVRYSSYGEPTVYPVADVNRDGIVNYDDMTAFGMGSTTGDFAATADGEADLDFDGDIGSSGDIALFMDSYDANTGQSGKGRVSSAEMGNRKGYAGYEWDQVIAMSHVRHRVYWAEIGRWTRRDPLGYADGTNLHEYCTSATLKYLDPFGLETYCGEQDDGDSGGGETVGSGGWIASPPTIRPGTTPVGGGSAGSIAGSNTPSFKTCFFNCMNDYYGGTSWIACAASLGINYVFSPVPKNERELKRPYKQTTETTRARRWGTEARLPKTSRVIIKALGRAGFRVVGAIGAAASCSYAVGVSASCAGLFAADSSSF